MTIWWIVMLVCMLALGFFIGVEFRPFTRYHEWWRR